MENFEKYLNDKPININKVFEIIVEEIEKLIKNNFDFSNSIFEHYKAEIKMLLQSNQKLFWDFWEYCEKRQKEIYTKKENEITKELRKNGICIKSNYFNKEQIKSLKDDWETAINSMPELNKEEKNLTLKNRFSFKIENEINYVQSSEFDGKKRVIFSKVETFPNSFKTLLNENLEFKEIIKSYFFTEDIFYPSAIMAEEMSEPKYSRNDLYWHIDNLSDQFKIMIILEDMTENDAPFIYKKNSHKIIKRYKDRYHKMYNLNGMSTQDSNHFEESFTAKKEKQIAVLKAGDIVLFDCKIHHSASFANNNGKRKNIVIYYNKLPTIKNKILFRIDSYLNFALK